MTEATETAVAGEPPQAVLDALNKHFEQIGVTTTVPSVLAYEVWHIVGAALSARTSTAPVAWVAESLVESLKAARSTGRAWEHVISPVATEKFTVPFYASPPPPQPGVRVTVKPLEWHRHERTDIERYTGEGQFVAYFLTKFADREDYDLARSMWGGAVYPEFPSFATADEGKAAAQADYETRIRSALTASIPDSGEAKP